MLPTLPQGTHPAEPTRTSSAGSRRRSLPIGILVELYSKYTVETDRSTLQHQFGRVIRHDRPEIERGVIRRTESWDKFPVFFPIYNKFNKIWYLGLILRSHQLWTKGGCARAFGGREKAARKNDSFDADEAGGSHQRRRRRGVEGGRPTGGVAPSTIRTRTETREERGTRLRTQTSLRLSMSAWAD